ncbi:MAG: hypothetical protein ACOYL3_02415 [Desulfuromonadaceae bacterium]
MESKLRIMMQLLLAVPGRTVGRPELLSALGHPDDEYGHKRVEMMHF